jgi:GT2 family glycosyltransferase
MPCEVSALITAYDRPIATLRTIETILACDPVPKEILVHVDAGQHEVADAIRGKFPDVRLFVNEQHVGPGGGRNVLLENASCDICASFDDDSFPACGDYFGALLNVFSRLPEASLVTVGIVEDPREATALPTRAQRVASFCGCACAYRKSRARVAGTYVPIPIAYGMEEQDLALRIHHSGGSIYFEPALLVIHECDFARRATAKIIAAALQNTILLCLLRYPFLLWPIGIAQVTKFATWNVARGHSSGLLQGFLRMPRHVRRYWNYRKPVSASAVLSYLWLKRMTF